MRNKLSLALLAAFAVASVACGSDPKPEPKVAKTEKPKPKVTGKVSAKTKGDSDGDGNAGKGTPVGVDDAVVKMCNLPEARFGFDSSSVGSPAKNVLDAIAKCFVDGPGKDKGLRIVGHADARGETSYNLALGHRRAASIADYLSKNGVAEKRIATSSEGERQATGTTPDGWARDRKVEIFLAE